MTFKFRSEPDGDSGRFTVNVFVSERDAAFQFAGLLTLRPKEWQTFVRIPGHVNRDSGVM